MALTKRLLVLSPIKSPCSSRPFSAMLGDLSYSEDSKNQRHRALTIVNLVTPEASVASDNKSRHNRLIEDILQTLDTSCVSARCCGEKSSIDAADLSLALSLCGSSRDLRAGVRYHCAAIRSGFVANVYVGTSLVGLYGNCSELGYALQVFDEMPVRNVVTWTAVIAGFAREWRVGVCLELFRRMRVSDLRPNCFTFTSLLSACSGSGALENGRSVHSQTIRAGFHSYVFVSNTLVSMYCKCGALGDALRVFTGLDDKDTVSWNSMIAGYAQHGLALQAIDLFEEMMQQSVKPDGISFLAILSSCRHAGLVEKGRLYFNKMAEHGVEPELDHFSCVVDLLGRAGLLEEARDVITKMPIAPNAVIWGAMLSTSRLHGNLWFGIEAAESRLALEPSCAATYLQLANLYAGVGWWDRAALMRKLMKDRGLKTIPGYSWIEIKNVVHKFRAEDKSNTKMVHIVSVLDSLLDHISTLGCDAKQQELYIQFSSILK